MTIRVRIFWLIMLTFLFGIGCKNIESEDKSLIEQKVTKEEIVKTNSESIISKKELSFLMGRFEPKTHPDFTLIDKKYADRSGLYMQEIAYDAFVLMYDAAKLEGVILEIRSATRNFDYQKGIWERKWTGKTKVNGKNLAKTSLTPIEKAKEILKYSSMPGSSRHHWGTDIDLNSFDNPWFENGKGKKLFDWLKNNAARYGYHQVYTDKKIDNRSGYEEEKWHWTYLPISKKYTQSASKHLKDSFFNGFLGFETAKDVKIVDSYILGISL